MKSKITKACYIFLIIASLGAVYSYLFIIPSLIDSDFWRGVLFPFMIFLSVFVLLFAFVIFWFEVLERE